jgi:hypothetical protein
MRPIAVLVALALGVVLIAGLSPPVASADGEAGVVIQHGDGSVEAFCIGFTGESIAGDQLLRRAAIAQENVNGLVCSVGQRVDEGCYGAGTFEACTCKCRSAGSSCSYWAFYTQKYGQQWQYSAFGFLAQRSRDGDLQGWRWGQGSANSAPPPAVITFEQVCGHAPRAGVAPTNAAPAATATTATTPRASPGATTGTEPTVESVTPPATAPQTVPADETRIITIDATTSPTEPERPPVTSVPAGTGGSEGTSGGIAFGLVAGGLGAMIVAALAWKRVADAKWRKRRGQ